ncbi:carboxypeptidase N subunit 2-like isoform X2 [Anneissia japonica]|uniref:carboxypeptidase N subunit 2-like isoform X2 n=1 Tax=Anneissia japonica TaxID=1529436 RepID=UPI0014259FB3|nr:carboxypeptidase N subunit 2-like isoform X2 [Anneissia japonica]
MVSERTVKVLRSCYAHFPVEIKMYIVFAAIILVVKQASANCNQEGKTCEWNFLMHQCRCHNLDLTCIPPIILECKNLISLHLSSNNITSINAKDLYPYASLKELFLANNKITSIALGSFQYMTQLEGLYLDGNMLPSLQNEVFNGLTGLTQLDLSFNKIKLIESNVFRVLETLVSLDLSGNQLSELPSNIFLSLSDLIRLDLSSNIFTQIPAVFDDLKQLQMLNLESNNISTIKNRTFANLENLQNLYLGKNNIENLQPEILLSDTSGMESSGLHSLTELDIYDNNLKEITKDFMQHLPGIESLNLAGNQINFIEAASFGGMDNLHSLKLRQNQLQYLNADIFKDEDSILDETCANKKILRYLQDLNLAENKLNSAPSADFFSMVPSLLYLEMQGNPFRCDCDILQMVNWFNNSKHVRSTKYDLGKCAMPSNLEGIETATLNSSSMTTPCKNTSIKNRQTLISASPGDEVILNCSTSGFPRPIVCWEVPKNLNSASLAITQEHVVIHSVSAQQEGSYVCYADNIFNNVSVTYKVEVIDKSESQVTSVTLTNNGPIDSKNKTSSYDGKVNALKTFTITATILLFATACVIIYMVRFHGKRALSCRNLCTEQDIRNQRIARDQRRVYTTLVEERDENINLEL